MGEYKTLIDITGQRFGRLVALSHAFTRHSGAWWTCQCDCGTIKEIYVQSLRTGETRSCGCLRKEWSEQWSEINRTHGMSRHPLYYTWASMKQRCRNSKSSRFESYGARGIKIEWSSFEEFANDMLPSYLEHRKMHTEARGTSIERVDNQGNYSKENCKWVTLVEQSGNRRHNLHTSNRLGAKGVQQVGRRYYAKISHNGELYYLGAFPTLQEAADAYDRKAVEFWGSNAVTNKSLKTG